jgi:hypothetical protein
MRGTLASTAGVLGASNDEPVQDSAPRRDAQGELLTQGALARLGSARFRVSGQTTALAFGPGDQTVLAYGRGTLRV